MRIKLPGSGKKKDGGLPTGKTAARIRETVKQPKKFLHMGKTACAGVVLAFSAVYFSGMLLVTYMEKGDIETDYVDRTYDAASNFIDSYIMDYYDYRNLAYMDELLSAEQETEVGDNESYFRDALYKCLFSDGAGNFMMSAAIYDEAGELLLQSSNQIRISLENGEGTVYADLAEFLTEDEIQELAEFESENNESVLNEPEPYRYQAILSKGRIPAYIDVIEKQWEIYTAREDEVDEVPESLKNQLLEKEYYISGEPGNREITVEGDEATVWRWKNPDIPSENIKYELLEAQIDFPAIEGGYGVWKKWMNDAYFQDFPDRTEPAGTSEGYYQQVGEGNRYEIRATFDPPYSSSMYEGRYILVLRVEQHPWLAAMDSLKFIYLGSLAFLIVCMACALWIMERTYRQKERMETQRRDFINIMAHEIKTPLSVIRGFSENLKENPDTKKREYYLEQIIRQTEDVDGLVKEMITTSQVDWKQVKFGENPVSLKNVLECETDRLAAQAEERRLNVTMRCEDDWTLKGDRRLLEQAFFCILSNAVSYNRDEGRIRIVLRSGSCIIENTGENIPSEHLPHVCEMFYTVNQSKNGREKHLGMGLYLASQIFSQHGAALRVENTEEGVRVTVEKK